MRNIGNEGYVVVRLRSARQSAGTRMRRSATTRFARGIRGNKSRDVKRYQLTGPLIFPLTSAPWAMLWTTNVASRSRRGLRPWINIGTRT